MDYKKFLAKKESLVLPYLGGDRVHARDRRLRVMGRAEPGWQRFEVSGRNATATAACDAPDLSDLPAVRGHFVDGWLFCSGATVERVELVPAEEPAALSPLCARRWPSGDLLFDAVDFEGEAEGEARRALEDGLSIAGLKGVAASLRAAFGFAVLLRASRRLNIPVGALEARARAIEIGDEGAAGAEELLRRLDAERQAHRVEVDARRIAQRARARAERAAVTEHSSEERARAALEAAGAELLAYRALGDTSIEVTFRFMGERFISVADAATLQVVDAGVCLAGADSLVTLESLPSVIKEAIDQGELNITRR